MGDLNALIAFGFAVWVLCGLALAAFFFYEEGLPDREGWDGPEVEWGRTVGIVCLCAAVGPIGLYALYKARSSAALSARTRTATGKIGAEKP